MQNNLKYVALLAGIAFSGAALAESASEQLTRIEAETLLLKAREKQLDVQASIMARQNEIASRKQVNEQLTQNAVVGNPVIRSIEGIGRTMYATLQLADGSLVEAKVGDVLSNGMKIASISANEVIVESGKKHRVRLAAAVPMQVAPAAAPVYANAGLPLPLPVAAPRGSAR
jgi:type IV pilus biogenesis protein PilP